MASIPSFFHFSGLIILLGATRVPAQSPPRVPSANSPDTAFQRGLIALEDNRLEFALTELTAAERQAPQDARIRNFRGVTLARLGRNDEAAQEYHHAVRLDPDLGDAYRNLGLLEWTEHRLDVATADLRHALAIAADDSFAHYYLGRVLLDSKDYADGLSELNRSSVPLPEDPDFLVQLAIAYNTVGQHEEEGRIIDRLVTVQLNAAQSLAVADLLLSAKRTDAAIQFWQRLSQGQAGHGRWARFDLARTYLVAENYRQAAVGAHDYIESSQGRLSPTELAPGWSLLGIAEANLKNSDSALSAFRQAARLQPGNEEYCLNLTRELMELDHYAEAISELQAGLASNPTSYALHLRLGAAYLAAGRYTESEQSFRQLVDANDPLPISYIGLAQVLLRTGRAEAATAELAAAEQKLGPSFLIAYFHGLALKQAGKHAEAASAFAEAVQLNPSNAEAHRDLGSTLLALNKSGDAISELKQSLRLAPNDLRTRRLLTRAYARSGDVTTARQYLSAELEPPVPVAELQGDFILPGWQPTPQEDAH